VGRETDWPCVVSIVAGGLVLWGIAISMLRRGAPLAPRGTSLIAGVAALSLANVEACISRAHAFAVTVVVWHGAATMLVLLAAMALAAPALPWRRTPLTPEP
jgi:hypothetical protein